MPWGLSIGDLARRYGLRTSALRYGEDRGLLPPVERDSAGRRRYHDDQVRRVAFIRMCQDAMLPLDVIAVMMSPTEAEDRDWRDLVRARIGDLDRQIATARAARDLLRDSLRCPSDHPAHECPYVQRMLDVSPRHEAEDQ